jgi:hypothetical protein
VGAETATAEKSSASILVALTQHGFDWRGGKTHPSHYGTTAVLNTQFSVN